MKVIARTGQMFMTALLAAKQDKRQELQQALVSILDGIQRQPGCLDCLASQDLEGESRFHLHLVWRDRAALEAFMAGEVYHILLGALNILAAPMEFQIVAAVDAISPMELALAQTEILARMASPP
ncbi:MAG: antibiotic biosynthesis monooxygenase [Holophaga sp.]|nr:antibiotic biosynthesis monooxygenase [Holophaga sp.]